MQRLETEMQEKDSFVLLKICYFHMVQDFSNFSSVVQNFRRNGSTKSLCSWGAGLALGVREGGQAVCQRDWPTTLGSLSPPCALLVVSVELMQSAELAFSHGKAVGSETEMRGRAVGAASPRERELLMCSPSLTLLSSISHGQWR